MPMAQELSRQVAKLFADRYESTVVGHKANFKKIADGDPDLDLTLHERIMSEFQPFKDILLTITKRVFGVVWNQS